VPEPSAWLSDPDFDAALRHRLGMPTASVDTVCGLCRLQKAGCFGEHSLCCKNGGARTLMHHAIVDTVHTMASAALLNSKKEPTVPVTGPARIRADLVMDRVGGGSCTTYLDVAVTCPTQPSLITVAGASPGAGAAAYADRHKVPRYSEAMRALNDAGLSASFCPLVVDTFGAWDPRAVDVFRRISAAWGRRTAVRRTTAMQILMHRLSTTVARGVSRILVAASAPDLPRLDRDVAGAPANSFANAGAAAVAVPLAAGSSDVFRDTPHDGGD
jgi:hypothetical protein